MASLNIGQIFSELAAIVVDAEVDGAELAAGQNVAIPVEPVVASIAGKPVYLNAYLSTTKQTAAPPLSTPSAATTDIKTT